MSAAEPQAPVAARPFEIHGFRGVCRPGARAGLETILASGIRDHAEAGRVLRRAMSRVTSRVAWPAAGTVLLKVHRTRSFGERLLARLRGTRAQAEWEAACFLEAAGLPIPAPLAVGEERCAGLPRTSFYVAGFLEAARPLDRVLADAEPAGRRALLQRVAACVRTMHDNRFDHRDLHGANVLVTPAPGGQVLLSDLHRHRIGRVGSAARRAALAVLLHSLRARLTRAEELHLLRAYLGSQAAQESRWQTDIERRIRRRERRRRASRAKRCLRESTVYTRDVGSGWGARRRNLSLERLERVLEAHDRALAGAGVALLKHGRRSVVTRVEGLVVKERLAPDPWSALRDRILPRRHAAGYRHAHTLDVLGVGTALAMAHVRRRGRTWTLYEDLGHLERLDHRARRVYASDDRPAQVELREASAVWLGRLHREGVYHGDLKGVNVLVGDGPRFHLIDTDRCRFERGVVGVRRRAKNLAQLDASIPRAVTRSERLRWYRRYREALGVFEDEAALARDVARRVRRRVAVVDEPIE